jgi:hypothetical protein
MANANELDFRVGLKNLVAQQLPEFIRAEYPTFVAFVEAYYEFLDNQGVNLNNIRDIDETLEDYIKFFKAELAHNYPVVSKDYKTERFLLKHIKEQYLAKGSEASYKLLFRLLYGKDVFIDYPGRQMLRISDGRWQQEVSLFVKVSQGDASKVIGKTVTIQTAKRIYNTDVVKGVDAATAITATVENAIAIPGLDNVYEIFLDRNFYGDIYPNNSIKYGSEFQAVILPCTAKIKINQPGKNFRPGMVFQLKTGEGTPFWFKVSSIDGNGGLKTIDTIRFGLQYNTDFSVTVLPSSAVSSKRKITQAVSNLTFKVDAGKIRDLEIVDGGVDYTLPPLITIDGDGTGAAAHAVISGGEIVDVIMDNLGDGYTYAFVNVTPDPLDVTGTGGALQALIGADYDYTFKDNTDGFTESGYLNEGDYWDITEHGRLAAATAIINDNVITDINVTNGGSGYTTATVSIADTTGTGTTASVVIESGVITKIVINNFGHNYTNPTVTITGDGAGAAATAVVRDGCVTGFNITNPGIGYDLNLPVIDIDYPNDGLGGKLPHKATAKPTISNGLITSIKVTYPGYGYTLSSLPTVRIYGSYGYANGAYVGSIARQFFINASDTVGRDPAILNVSLEAVAKYPGYYKTNDGFLDDSMFIQDSYYYQSFAYVLKIDEQLESYASVIRSMLHPSGMAMFGEYSINNKVNLQVALTSLVKSLGITLYDEAIIMDGWQVDQNGVPISGNFYSFYKDLSTTYSGITETITNIRTTKVLSEIFVNMTEPVFTKVFGKRIGFTGSAETVFAIDEVAKKTFTKPVQDTTQLVENFTNKFYTKNTLDFQPVTEQHAIDFTLNTIIDPLPGVYPETGFLVLNPYDEGSYQAEHYSNERDSTFST